MSRRHALLAMLAAHAPSDAHEAEHKARMLALLDSTGDPMRRDHFVPGHFTASGFVLSPAGDALLLIHHRKLKLWLQPGGHIEPDDPDVTASARREVAEETGLTDFVLGEPALLDLDVHAIPVLGSDPPHEHFDVRFLFRARDLTIHTTDETDGARWFALRELAEAFTDESVRRAARKLIGS